MIIILLSTLIICASSDRCDVDEKVRFGPKLAQEFDCLRYGGCWNDTFKCYYANDHIPGFIRLNGEYTTGTLVLSESDITARECARICLRKTTCEYFVYDSQNKICSGRSNPNVGQTGSSATMKTYMKEALKDWTFHNFLCPNTATVTTDIGTPNVNTPACAENCKTQSDCDFITVVRNGDQATNENCVLKKTICPIDNTPSSFESKLYLPGPAFPGIYDNNNQNLVKIRDAEALNTCVQVNNASNFNLRVPWPTIGQYVADFKVIVKGNNMKKCLRSTDALQSAGVIVYLPIHPERNIIFTGSFAGCKLESGNDETNCKYACSCGYDYCEAVYIRGFGSDDDNMEICYYNIL
ncbi:unnamed protein product [Dimorphilus gyrociliatus]|uniref:Apple domain-containing protein n=1 Tax=Dimorphilus gyrociliatus TaxID=2664684 RepID=A0A7I8VE38_9ANNE|nr:unnamed protein product [Dimorphilus gyrociliatus]